MKIQSKILVSIVASVVVAAVIVLIAFSILRGMNTELARSRMYDQIINKTDALNALVANLREGSGQSDVRQVNETLGSLDNLLKKMTSTAPREEALIRQLQKNNEQLGPVIDQMLVSGQEAAGSIEKERRNILASQIWMQVRFISDDTNRLNEISQERIISALGKAGATIIVLIIILALTNGTIYFLSGRSIVRAQEALRQSEERLRVTLSSIGDAVIATDAAGQVTFLNPIAADLTGWYLEEALGQPIQGIFKIINEKTRQSAENLTERVLSEGYTIALANHSALVTREGREIPIEDSAAPIKDSEGNVSGVVLVFHDVTERRRAQEALRESEESLRLHRERMPIGCIVYDEEFHFVQLNPAAERIFGYRAEELIGRHAQVIVPPDAQPHVDGILRRLAAGEMTAHGINENLTRDNRIIFCDWLNTPLKDPQGKFLGFLSMVQDVTEKKAAEVALRESEQRFRGFYESDLLGVIFWNMDGVITDTNDKFLKMVGYDRKDLSAGRIDWIKITPPEYRHLDEASVTELKATGVNKMPFEKEYIRKDGSRIPILVAGAMLDEARFNGVAFVLDITERKQIEHEREITVELLGFINQSTGASDLVRSATTFFQQQSGCEAVGIRLKEGDDFPYYEARGFPEEFILMENSLCSRDAAGNIIRDSAGDPYIECICGNVILGRIDVSKPFFSPGGSFWANSTTRLLATTSDADRQTRTRNRCNGEGYESVALIPLYVGTDRFGLIQLNDRRKNMFSPDIIALWERLTGYLAIALAKCRTEEQLRESERRFFLIYQKAPFPIALSRSEDGVFVDVNEQWEETFGFTKQEAIGKTSIGLGIHRDFELRARHHTELLQQNSVRNVELRLFTKSGEGRLFLGNLNAVTLEEKQYLLSVVEDITERKKAEEALQRQAELLHLSYDAIIVWQLGGVIQSWNKGAEELYGYSAEEAVGQTTRELLKTIHSEPWPLMEAELRERKSWEGELKHYTREGREVIVSARHQLVRGSDGVERVLETNRDITDRKKMEWELRKSRDELELRVQERTAELKTYMSKLEQSNQALRDFASIASHDMKEPLRKVISFGNMLRQKHKDSLGQTGNDYLNRMLGATERMQSLLTGLLEYSRVTTNPGPFSEVDLYDMVNEVLSDLEVRIEKTGGEVQVGELPAIEGDPTQMRQLFQNLIGNALKFHKQGEKPVVEVRSAVTDNSEIQIVVEDNGIGFEEQYLEKIFAPFQRLHGRSSPYEGTGMGLAICKKIVERHGGSITARSTPGHGATFIITLPSKQPD